MDGLNNFEWMGRQAPQGGAAPDQAQQWNMESRAPQPQPLVKAAVADISGDWQLLYRAPQGSFVTIKEILLGNMTAGDVVFAFAFLDDDDAVPSGPPAGQENVFFRKSIPTLESRQYQRETSLLQGWRLYGYSDAAAGEKANVLITGLVVSYL